MGNALRSGADMGGKRAGMNPGKRHADFKEPRLQICS
jgi:hypothetical protein